jgi:hypothetical protein
MGTAQQTICQNKQLFPLSTLCRASKLLSGYQIPTSQVTTASVAPINLLGGLAGGALQLFCGKNGTPIICSLESALGNMSSKLGSLFGSSGAAPSCPGVTTSLGSGFYNPTGYSCPSGALGCPSSSSINLGCCPTLSGLNLGFSGGYAKGGPVVGCASTVHRGALPRK